MVKAMSKFLIIVVGIMRRLGGGAAVRFAPLGRVRRLWALLGEVKVAIIIE